MKLLNVTKTQSTLLKLAEAGVGIALDDFGEGYSSYGRLIKLPFQTIKIGRNAAQKHLASREGMNALVRLARYASQHKKEIVVEGIESKEQVNVLVRLGISKIQGFVFSRPLPEQAFLQYVRDHHQLTSEGRTVA